MTPAPFARRALLVLCLGAGPAAPLAAQAVDCADAVTTVDINACAAAAWEEADLALNGAYGAAVAAAREADEAGTGTSEETLREAQRLWVAFRDAACEAEAQPFQPGTITTAIHYGCLERLTLARTDDLRAYAENWGG